MIITIIKNKKFYGIKNLKLVSEMTRSINYKKNQCISRLVSVVVSESFKFRHITVNSDGVSSSDFSRVEEKEMVWLLSEKKS